MRNSPFTTRALIALTAVTVPGVRSALATDGAAVGHHAPPPFVFPTGASAFVTLRPTTTEDGFEPADITAPGTGRLTLREAFALSSRLNVETTIVLQRGAIYRLTRCAPPDSPANSANELVHTANQTLTITGSAATIRQTCDGAGVLVQKGGDQLFNIVDLTLAGGRAANVPGGAVTRFGPGEVRITNTAIVDNRVTGMGRGSAGGVFGEGEVFISGATFARNSSDRGVGGAAAMGAIKAIKSSFHDNDGPLASALSGGRIALPPKPDGPPPFTGQTSDGVTLVYSTLNEASGPAVRVEEGRLTAFASVIAGGPQACDLGGRAARSLGANLARGGGCGLGGGPGDIADGPDPRLAAVTGMKQTDVFAPTPGSPLLDAIAPAACLPPQIKALLPVYSGGDSDQLGVPRTQGRGCDIGAIEAIAANSLERDVGVVPLSELPQMVRWGPSSASRALATAAIVVDTTRDTLGGAGVSVRDAIARANAAADETTIVLEPRKIYRLDRCVAPQVAVDNETNDLVFVGDRHLTVEGNGSTIVQTCDGAGVLSIFGNGSVSLVGTTITGGRAMIHPGGGIYLAGTGSLRLERSWITDNVSVAAGGGLAAFGPVVMLESTVSNNHSTEVGGGIIGTDDVTLISSSVFDNIADLAIGAVGNHSGRLTLIFSTIAHNSSPNIAVGSLSSFGSIIADYIPPVPPLGGAGAFGPPPGPPAGSPSAPVGAPAGPSAGAGGPPPGGSPMGGFPPPANCSVEHPVQAIGGNIATDASCGFETVARSVSLSPARSRAPVLLVPTIDGTPVARLSAAACEAYRTATDQIGQARWSTTGCTIGAVSVAPQGGH